MHRKEWDYSLFGKFLGDGYVDKNRRNQLVIKHCGEQKEYVWSIYRAALESHMKLNEPTTQTNGQEFLRVPITARHYNFNRAWKSTGVKYPSKYMLDRLTPLGLLWLWLDDGSFRINSSSGGRQGRLSTCAFTVKEVDKMIDILGKRFNLTGIHSITQNGYPMIYFNATGMQQLVDAVRPVIDYCPPCMRYKLDLQYTDRFENNPEHYNQSAFPPYRYGG